MPHFRERQCYVAHHPPHAPPVPRLFHNHLVLLKQRDGLFVFIEILKTKSKLGREREG